MKHLLWVGIPHMVLLYLFGRSLPVTDIVVQSLHKAGFLHTLIGLGAAVMAVAQEWGRAGEAGLVLAPIGAALVPHVLGVWFGHQIEMKNYDFDADNSVDGLRIQSEKKVKETLELLNHVQRGFKDLAASLDSALKECSSDAQRLKTATGAAVTGIKTASDVAVVGIKAASGSAVDGISAESGATVGKIAAASGTAVSGIRTASANSKDGIESALRDVKDILEGTKRMTDEVASVTKQLKVLVPQIIELLKTPLIKEKEMAR